MMVHWREDWGKAAGAHGDPDSIPGAGCAGPAAGSAAGSPAGTPRAASPASCTVRTATDLPAGLMLGACPASSIIHTAVNCSDDQPSSQNLIQVSYENGRVRVRGGGLGEGSDWLRAIQPARDRHEQNVELSGDEGTAVLCVQTLRHISAGQDLLIWYSDTLATLHSIPVLSPANIRGDQQYSCNYCPATYRHPNVLKSHIRYHCSLRNKVVSDMRPPLTLPSASSQPYSQPYFSLAGPFSRHLRKENMSPSATATAAPALKLSQLRHDQISAFCPPEHKSLSLEQNRDARRDHEGRLSSPRSARTSPASPDTIERSERLGQRSPEHSAIDLSLHHRLAMSLPQFGHHSEALKLYYPFYSHIPGQLPGGQFYPLSNYLPNYINPYALLPYRMHRLVQSESSPLPTTPDKGSPEQGEGSGHPVPLPHNYPLPSEKEGEPLDLLPRSLYMSKSRKGHLCIYCGKLYSRKYGLKIHLRTHTGYKPLKCKVCLRPFGDPSNLNKHIRLHSDSDTPYRCEYCGKVLVRRRDLERHIKSRHPNGHLVNTQNDVMHDVTEGADTGSDLNDTDSKETVDDDDENDEDLEEIEVVS